MERVKYSTLEAKVQTISQLHFICKKFLVMKKAFLL